MYDWYSLNNAGVIDSPALIIYRDRVNQNIHTAISMVGDVKRLRPHIKTAKSTEAAQLMLSAGITKFKCSTIAEAEMLAILNVPDVLLAYQPVGPKLQRFITLVKQFPGIRFSCLVDSKVSLKGTAEAASDHNIKIHVFIDVNNGMDRTGIAPEKVPDLYQACSHLQAILPLGLHVYDGHITHADFQQRAMECNKAFEKINDLQKELCKSGLNPVIIAGGSPTFPIHAGRKNIECSPGTFIYWDKSYQQTCAEQNFVPAALVIARVVSMPAASKLCIDLGHKSVASENALHNRVHFLNAPELKFISHSEEHLVAEAPQGHAYNPGDILYGLPFHICPTVALYEKAFVAENGTIVSEWKTLARDRKITV